MKSPNMPDWRLFYDTPLWGLPRSYYQELRVSAFWQALQIFIMFNHAPFDWVAEDQAWDDIDEGYEYRYD